MVYDGRSLQVNDQRELETLHFARNAAHSLRTIAVAGGSPSFETRQGGPLSYEGRKVEHPLPL